MTKNERIEEYLGKMYDFRYNEIRCIPEWKLKEGEEWQQMTTYFINSLKRELGTQVYWTKTKNDEPVSASLSTSVNNLQQIIESDFVNRFNPIKDYFDNLPKWDGTDHIKQLFDCLPVKKYPTTSEDTEIFEIDHLSYFTRWLAAVIKNALNNEICENHVCFVLIGPQGSGKTTFLETLCPPQVKDYLYTGKIDPNNKDTLILISENLFINIDDQLSTLFKKEANDIKNLITVNKIKLRRHFDKYINEYPHLASFTASINSDQFISDSTGSRRFLVFEISTTIDFKKLQAVNINQVYAQAKSLLKTKGFKHYITYEEIDDINRYNSRFESLTVEEELLVEYFDCPEPSKHKDQANYYAQTSTIKAYLQNMSGEKHISLKKLGEALNKRGFVKWQKTTENPKTSIKTRLWVWSLIKKNLSDINREIESASYTQKWQRIVEDSEIITENF